MSWKPPLPELGSTHVAVGLSGGVDSAVTAWLLQKQGYHVTALFMKNWEGDDSDDYCSAEADLADAAAVCDVLSIPLETANFSHEYWRDVFSHFLDEHQAGRTPNPDVLCNREIKFKALLEHVQRLGADFLATGHYAAIRRQDDQFLLTMATDRNKDQTYFLHLLNQAQLNKAQFPLASLTKPEIRRIAEQQHLPVADKKDSTGICFIGERPFRQFLSEYLPDQPGDIIDLAGNVLARHNGLMYYTIGQRQGLGIGGRKHHGEEPWYVAEKLVQNNQLLVVQGHNHPKLFAQHLTAIKPHWITGHPPASEFECLARNRHRQPLQKCTVKLVTNSELRVTFDLPQRALTPGQSIVFYQHDICLGGGVIDHTSNKFDL